MGWGIPMATDIAFALGVLTVLGARARVSLKVFVTALAIADDLGAIGVIALFYTAQVHWQYLGIAALPLIGLVSAARIRLRQPVVYVLLGWFCGSLLCSRAYMPRSQVCCWLPITHHRHFAPSVCRFGKYQTPQCFFCCR